jgi:hypothetical protein
MKRIAKEDLPLDGEEKEKKTLYPQSNKAPHVEER